MHRPRVLIIGIDGGTLDLIDPWVAAGHLPNIAGMMASGSSGRLISTLQPVTSIAWATFMTGVNAGKHGLYDFVQRRPGSYALRITHAADIKSRTLLEMAGDYGKRVVSINVPYTAPPRPVNGIVVGGPFAPTLDSSLVFPSETLDTVRRLCPDYFILPDFRTEVPDPLRDFAGRLLEEIRQRELLCLHFMRTEAWDLCAVVFMAADEAHHSFWEFMASPTGGRESAYADVILSVYKELDRAIGRLLAQCEADSEAETSVIVMSDHGAGPLKALINLNHWLAGQGLLAFHGATRNLARLDRARLVRGLAGVYRRSVPAGLRNRIRGWLGARAFNRIKGDVESALGTSLVNWSKTQVYAVGSGGNLYINLRGREPQGVVEPGLEYEKVRAQLRQALMTLKDPVTGMPVVWRVHTREELYQGDQLADAPDLIIEWADYSYWGRGSYQPPSTPVFQQVRHFDMSAQPLSGTHRLEGFYIIRGGGMPARARGPDVRLVDIAPTCLALLGLPLPAGLDGRPLARGTGQPSTSRGPAVPAENDGPKPGYSEEDEQTIARRLQDLGYF